MTVYLVCGLHRSGTSVMMAAVTAGSTLTPLRDADFEAIIESREKDPSNYPPNPLGYFAHQNQLIEVDDWIGSVSDGTVCKVSPLAITDTFPEGDYRVIVTQRDEDERTMSMSRAFGADTEWFEPKVLENALGILTARADCTVTIVNYADLIADPVAVFDRLVADGWPIYPDAAAAVVNPDLYRNRLT